MTSGPSRAYLAVDLGAESVRVSQVSLSASEVEIRELLRIVNRPLRLPDRTAWNITGIFDSVLDGIAAAGNVRSIGIDGWGVDFALLRADGSLLALPRSYRDPLTEGILDELFRHIARERLFERTGIQMMEINTLCQLLAMRCTRSSELEQASMLLLLPDLISLWLGGEAGAELTNASTTQMLAVDGTWAVDVLEACSLPPGVLPPVLPTGERVGRLRPSLDDRAKHRALPIVAVASHDTGSAVVGAPLLEPESTAFISSGTWSLVGVEQDEACNGGDALARNLSNERGYDGTYRLLRNVMGMWLVQRCRAEWAREDGAAPSYDELLAGAAAARPFGALIDPDHPDLLRASDMPAAIRNLCLATGQQSPATREQILSVILESLALRYRWVLDAIAAVTTRKVTALRVVGGGARNDLLCQLTATATHLPVFAGPVEATTIGNAIVQSVADGHLPDVHAGRELVARTARVQRHEPVEDQHWDEAYARFCALPTVGSPVLASSIAP